MKKNIIIIVVGLALMGATQAQISVNAGYSDTRIKTSGQRAYWQGGAFGGLSYNVALGSHFGIAPGAYLNISESSGTSRSGSTVTTTKYTEIGADIPLHLTFSVDVARGASIYAFAGPELNCGISAQSRVYTAGATGGYQSQTYDYYNAASVGADEQLRRINVSGTAGIGMRNGYANLMFGVGRTLMNCRASDAIEESSLRLFLGAGVMF